MPATALEAFAPLTRAKLLAIEVIVDALEAEQDLRDIMTMHAVFVGGKEAGEYVRSLRRRAGRLDELRAVGDGAADEKRRRKAEMRAKIRAFQVALSGIEARSAGRGQSCPPA